MSSIFTRRAGIRLIRGLALGSTIHSVSGCDDLGTSSPCDEDPAFSQCAQIALVTPSIPIRVNRLDSSRIDLQVKNMAVTAKPMVSLMHKAQPMAPATPLLPIPVQNQVCSPGTPSCPATLSVGLDPNHLPANGPANFVVQIGSRSTINSAGSMASTLVYTNPTWALPISRDYPADRIALSVFIQSIAADKPGSIFVGEDDLAMSRNLARYDLQESTFVATGNLPMKTKVNSTAMHPVLFAVNKSSALVYYYLTSWIFGAVDLGGSTNKPDTELTTQGATLLASEPGGLFHVLYGNNQLEFFQFDTTVEHMSKMLVPTTDSLSFLAARHYTPNLQERLVCGSDEIINGECNITANPSYKVAKDVPFDLLTVDSKNNKFSLYALSADARSVITLDDLSTAANAAFPLPAGAHILAMTLSDIDMDGLPDLILAVEDQSLGTGKVSTITWLPYVGGGVFGAVHSEALPTNATGVIGMAVGNVIGDAKPDLAIVTTKSVYVYPNIAP